MVTQHLPESFQYLVQPNASYDGNPLNHDEERFAEDSLPPEETLAPMALNQVTSWLWRNGKIPEWVDARVEAVDQENTRIRLSCCGRWTALEDLLYHQAEGYQPFHVTGPMIPPGWESIEINGRFDLEWSRRRRWDMKTIFRWLFGRSA